MNRPTPLALAIFVALQSMAHAQGTPSAPELPTVEVNASADASAQGLSPAYAGGYPGSGYLVVGAPRTFTLSASMDF